MKQKAKKLFHPLPEKCREESLEAERHCFIVARHVTEAEKRHKTIIDFVLLSNFPRFIRRSTHLKIIIRK